jgi:uncharacterized phiE125 gp8 family phage protein
MQKYTVTAGPSVEPVTSTELKLQTHVDHTAEDALLTSYILTARHLVEQWTGRALITQTRKALFQSAEYSYALPGGPVQSITSLKVYNKSAVATTVDASNYMLDALNGKLIFKAAGSFPIIDLLEVDPVEVIYVCGYGAAGSNVPEPLRQAILMLAAHYYEHREAVTLGNTAAVASAPVAYGVENLIEPYKVHIL